MNVVLRRLKDDKTQIRTNDHYLLDLLVNCGFAKFVKVSRIGTTFVIDDDLEKIPDSYTRICLYLKEKDDKNVRN